MKVTFPHMGQMWISVRAMLEYLGLDTIVPPPSTKKTLSLGSKYSPEFACMPLKLNLGNFIEASELGADTIVMAGGCGPCRFGYYAQVEKEILQDLGYNFNMIVMEPPEKHIGELLAKIKYISGGRSWYKVMRGLSFGFRIARAADDLERRAMKMRPRENIPGSTNRALTSAIGIISRVKSPELLQPALDQANEIMGGVRCEDRPVLKVGLVGEIYTILEPFANLDIEKKLGRLGVEVDRSIFLSEWVNDHLLKGFFKNMRSTDLYKKFAPPYLNHFVGGHGLETIGSISYYHRAGYDGAIQILPFTCMPEIVAQSILPGISLDTGFPVMTLIVDEQSGEAGLMTRLEAFVDLLHENVGRNKKTTTVKELAQ